MDDDDFDFEDDFSLDAEEDFDAPLDAFDAEFEDEEDDLYLDEADRGSAAKRRVTTQRAAKRKDTARITQSAADSQQRQIARAAKFAARKHLPDIKRASAKALRRSGLEPKARAGLSRLLASRFVTQAVRIAIRRAPGAITQRQILRLPILSLLTAAAIAVARKTGRIDEDQAEDLAERIYDMLSVTDMAIQLGTHALGEDEDYAEFEDAEEIDFEAPVKSGPCDCGCSKGDTVAMSRALKNAARQLLRAERRLSGQA